MSTITELFASVWRNFTTDGVPESGVHEPVKSDIRSLGAAIDTQKAEAVADLAAIKALTSRPLLVFVKALDQFYVWNAGSTATPDDETVIECTSGTAGRYLLWVVSNPTPVPVLSGHIDGLTYAKNGANTIDIDAGVAVANDGETVMSYAGDTALDLSVLFDDDGLLDTGSIANGNYELYLVRNPGTEDVRPLAVVEGDAPTLPSGYTQYRKFGWLKRVGGSIVGFKTFVTAGGGLWLEWTTPTIDVDASLSTTRRTDAIKVPLEFPVFATVTVSAGDNSNNTLARVCCPDETDGAPSSTAAPLANLNSHSGAASIETKQLRVRTSATGTIAGRATASLATYKVATVGFEWSRR